MIFYEHTHAHEPAADKHFIPRTTLTAITYLHAVKYITISGQAATKKVAESENCIWNEPRA